jgi:hypothetical protein
MGKPGESPVTDDIISGASELHGMLRRMAGINREQYPEARSGKVVVLGAKTYAVLANDIGVTVAAYHVSGPPTARQYMHIGLSDWRTLNQTYRRRAEDLYGGAR